MSPTQQLQELLDKAVQSIVVRERRQLATQYPVANYRKALREVRRHYAPSLRLALALHEVEIQDRTARDSLLGFLRIALRQYIHEDRIQTAIIGMYGGPTSGFHIDDLVKKLLQLAIALGPDRAAALFMNSLVESHCIFHNFTLLGGINVETPVELYDGVNLISLPKNDAALPGFLPPALFGEAQVERFRGGALLVEDWVVSPRYMNPKDYWTEVLEVNAQFCTALGSADVPDFNPSEFCKALSMVVKTRAFPSVSWSFVPDDEVADLRGTGSGYSWTDDPTPDRRTAVSEGQVQQAKSVYEALARMSPNDRVRLAIPIDRLIESWSGKGYVDQIIDLAIALESLYLPEHDSEMSYRLRNRGARFLESEVVQRKALSSQIRAFSRARSKAVHTGKIPESHTVGSRRVKTAELIRMTQDLCLRSIRQVIDGGFPDWETVELG